MKKLIKSFFPGGKNRMISEGMSLDLSHITPRMLAMSYPSNSFIESLYHNNIEEISSYLNTNYDKKYLIFNLSGIPYDNSKFNNSVIDFPWPDHKAPPLYDIFVIISKAFEHLMKEKDNIICLHCLAGKGRTGTVCCSLLTYAKLVDTSEQANDYYSIKRFKKINKAVQEPSQLRYIRYFDKLLAPNFNGLQPKVFEIQHIDISGIKLNDGESITYKIESNYFKENEVSSFCLPNGGPIVTGDLTINIYRNDSLKAWIFLNTFFMDENQSQIFLGLKDIDPRFLVDDQDYSCMTVSISYRPYYGQNQGVENNINTSDYNQNLSKINNMIQQEIPKINRMNQLLFYVIRRDKETVINENKVLFFGDQGMDIIETLNIARKQRDKK